MADISSAVTPPPQSQSQTSLNALSQDFDDFLTLLTTQLQNQDPLDPLESQEFTNQLVQFSQVEQQIRTNDHLEDITVLQDLSLTSIALGYIGLNVEIPGEVFDYESGPYQLSYNLPPEGAANVEVSIFDENDQLVSSTSGTVFGGKNDFVWDGLNDEGNPVEPGTYRISIAAVDEDGDPLTTSTNISATIDGIETVNGQLLLTADDLLIPFTSITSAFSPPTTQQQPTS